MNSNRYIKLASGLLCMLLACACQNEDIQDDSCMVPVEFVLQSSTSARLSRVNEGENPEISNVRDLYVDHVQVNIYKRPAGVYSDDESGFQFERSMVLECEEPTEADGDNFRYARGSIKLNKTYEYRSTAIGYSEYKNELDLFSFSEGGFFSDALVMLSDKEQFRTPELFFGTLRFGGTLEDKDSGDEVFMYEDGKKLTGWLYRCVAGVELELRDVTAEVNEVALLSSNMNTGSSASRYDDFLSPRFRQTVAEGEESDKFVLTKWTRGDDMHAVTDICLTNASLLPVTSTLSVRIKYASGITSLVTLRLKKKDNGSTPSYPGSGSGTGIIPDDSDESDRELARGQIAFKRNNYYRIAGDFETLAAQKLPLVLTVNPNWDGDVDLSLGGR